MSVIFFLVLFSVPALQTAHAREIKFITCPEFDREDAAWVLTVLREEYGGWIYLRAFGHEPDPFKRRTLVPDESCYYIRSIGFGKHEKILWTMHRRDHGTVVRMNIPDNGWREGTFVREIAEYGDRGNFFHFELYNEKREIVAEFKILIPKGVFGINPDVLIEN